MTNIVVTGGAGFIGTNFSLMMANKGHSVKIIDNLSRFSLLSGQKEDDDQNLSVLEEYPNIKIVKKDLRDYQDIRDEFDDADWVLHAAGQTGVVNSIAEPRDDFENNLVATFNVLEAIRNAEANPILIFCSTNKVFGTNPNEIPTIEKELRYEPKDGFQGIGENFSVDKCAHTPYGCSKLAADIYIQDYSYQYGLRTGVFRMSCIYGDYQLSHEYQGWVIYLVRKCLEEQRISIFGSGKQVRDILHVHNLVNAYQKYFSRAEKLGHEIFCIGGGPQNTISILELVKLVEKLTGKDIQIDFQDWRPSDQKIFITDNSKVSKLLDWSPEISPNEGIQRIVEKMANL